MGVVSAFKIGDRVLADSTRGGVHNRRGTILGPDVAREVIRTKKYSKNDVEYPVEINYSPLGQILRRPSQGFLSVISEAQKSLGREPSEEWKQYWVLLDPTEESPYALVRKRQVNLHGAINSQSEPQHAEQQATGGRDPAINSQSEQQAINRIDGLKPYDEQQATRGRGPPQLDLLFGCTAAIIEDGKGSEAVDI
jgi:hypothetical protein